MRIQYNNAAKLLSEKCGRGYTNFANKISLNPSGTEQENLKLPFASVSPPNNFEHTYHATKTVHAVSTFKEKKK